MASSCSQVEFKDSARMTGRKYIDYTKVVRLNFKITFGELVCLLLKQTSLPVCLTQSGRRSRRLY
jgi:hypothetical protein